MSNCDLCGIENALFRMKIEGSSINSCEKCSRFGKIIGKLNESEVKIKRKSVAEEKTESVIDGYDKIIRREREKKNLKQSELAKELNEKESVIQKIENKQMMPSLKLAKKMEKFFGIKLVENIPDYKVEIKKVERGGFTLGDAIKQKRAG